MNEKKLALLKLLLVGDIGPARFANLMRTFGSAEAVLSASRLALENVDNIGSKIAHAIKVAEKSDDAIKEVDKARKNNVDIVFYNDERYPAPLKNCPDKPLVLYIKGRLGPKDFSGISIVGSRNITNYGKSTAYEFASYFAKRGITIISGLARGVDSQAHSAALEHEGRTVAVLGNGLLIKYPPENEKLQEQIAQKGVLVSEYPLSQPPDKSSFPRRNRIIAALSRAVLVIEASKTSGALITARYAAEYGQDVFAVPGNIYSRYSEGTNELIQKGAFLALSPQDMARQLNLGIENVELDAKTKAELEALGTKEKLILEVIEKNPSGIALDVIIAKTQIDMGALSQIILDLQLGGFIDSLPGQIFIRKR
ncbi:MAG: DNA-processing protein DprA [Elusimicrobiota bacterium]|jgi:DNA processing protein|nr:DNA-processing protein DprA [Elusimicrobiota bacterium]